VKRFARRRALVAAGLLLVAALLGGRAIRRAADDPVASGGPAAVDADAASRRAARVARMMLEAPSLDSQQAGELADRSDRMVERLAARGEPDVRRMLRTTVVSEADARAYFEEHRALFGGRSFEASRLSVDRLVAIERVSAELGME
jgi:hypothetical protein